MKEPARSHAAVDTPADDAASPRQQTPAGIVTRVLAAVVDVGVVAAALAGTYLVVTGLRFVWSPATFSWPAPSLSLLSLLAGLLAIGYLTVAWATIGRTYGAGLLGLRVLSTRRRLLGWVRAMLRAVICVLFPYGLLWAAVSRRRLSLQDIAVRSIVVYDWHRDGGRRATAGGGEPATAPMQPPVSGGG